MLYGTFLRLISPSVPNWENSATYNPGDFVIASDGNLYDALNPLDENDDPIPNINKNPANPVNNAFWAVVPANFTS